MAALIAAAISEEKVDTYTPSQNGHRIIESALAAATRPGQSTPTVALGRSRWRHGEGWSGCFPKPAAAWLWSLPVMTP
jgi:hypothetical protein